MEAKSDNIAHRIAALKVSPAIQKGLQEFVSQIQELYREELISVTAFGSAVTGDYDADESDINLLVIYTDLDIVELSRVADLSRRWLRKYKFAPRFLSKRNIDESAGYFQIDFLSMRDAHVVIYGEDVLAGIEMRPEQLRWQIAYEVKAMRMRLKQQYWRTVDDPQRMRAVLADRFTSLVHVMRAFLRLLNLPAPVARHEIISSAVEHLGIDRECATRLLELHHGQTPDLESLNHLFGGLLEIIRKIDAQIEETDEIEETKV